MVDNLSAHKTQKVQAFLEAHPRAQLHFTPTYASRLNQVELGSAKIERDVLARSVFASLPDLARKSLSLHHELYQSPNRSRLIYSSPAHRITPHSADTSRCI